ncbi:YheC/YheD family protein [Paenibacillus hamazuiensis]|uniref:YheC/YheD family endospore coat-associated protein n=1 Tax=Paenibacillus hamazuiensis TaxID=2936508 RepID=UPI002010BC5E
MDIDAVVHEKRPRPTLAILTYDDGERIFRGNRENYIDLIRTGQELGVNVYVTTTSDFKISGKNTLGYVYDFNAKRWKKTEVPVPNVVYNRIPFRKFELLPEVQQTLQACLKHGQIRLFNPSFFNKWTLFEWLNKSDVTRKLVPATQKLTTSEDLAELLQKHRALYLKPVRGKAGKGIMKVAKSTSKLRPNDFQLSIQDKTRSIISYYPTISSLWTQIRNLAGNQDYIMQQAIPLATFKNRPFDLRVLVQKNAKGHWSVAGVGARLAGKLSITTHVPRGGSIDNPKKLLSSTFGLQDTKKIIRRTKRTAITIAKQIEKASGQTLGEMSMDLGVDTKGNLWFFEANSKPMKFDEPPIRKRSLENLINYSAFLAGMKKRKRTRARKRIRTRMRTRSPLAAPKRKKASVRLLKPTEGG